MAASSKASRDDLHFLKPERQALCGHDYSLAVCSAINQLDNLSPKCSTYPWKFIKMTVFAVAFLPNMDKDHICATVYGLSFSKRPVEQEEHKAEV